MTPFPEFSRLLNQYLARSDRSPAWLARRLGLHPSTVNRWLNQETRPATPELVIRVADLLGVHTSAERQALLAAANFAYLEGAPQAIEDAAPEALPNPLAQAARASAPQPRSRLPIATTSFVGRERELTQLGERLADPLTRLVTVVGQGGMGKSRLAIEAAARVSDHFAEGVCFVALAHVTSAGLIPAALAATLEIATQGAIDLEAQVARYLADKEALLILDNLEQLPDAAAFIERLLASAPAVKVLATSRVRLRIEQEWLFPLDGLTVPPSMHTSEDQTEYAAVKLFVQQARRLLPDFTLSEATTAEVIRICRLVGGMPLAIELAAAWLRSIALSEIAAEIQANLDFLATTLSDSDRHRSMHAVFDHSWRLLEERERHALMYMSVFRGGFTRQAVAEVEGADLRVLSGLVDSSWLHLDRRGRYEIHELARQYAEEKLDADAVTDPGTANEARAAHCAYYAALVEHMGISDGVVGENATKSNILLLELDNLWAGWRWAAANRNFDEIEKYVDALGWLADANGLYSEVVTEFEKLCALAREFLAGVTGQAASHQASRHASSGESQRHVALLLANLLNNLSYLYGRAISVELGIARGAESVELLRRVGLDGSDGEVYPAYLEALMKMSLVTAKHAEYQQARQYCDEMIRLTQGKSEYLGFYCSAINSLSQIAFLQGNFAEAEKLLMECQARATDEFLLIVGKDRLTHLHMDLGNLTRAAQFSAAAVKGAEKSGAQPFIASAHLSQAELAMSQDSFAAAEKSLERASVIGEETGNQYVRVRFLNGMGRLARLLGRAVEAQEFYGEAYTLADGMARKKDAVYAQVGLGFSLLEQGKLEDAKSSFHTALHAAWERRIMPEVIWAIVGLAALKGYEGQSRNAERWLRVAVAHPACPRRVQIEAMQIRQRHELAESDGALDEELVQEHDTALEAIVLEVTYE